MSKDAIIGSHVYDYEEEADKEKAKASIAGFRERAQAGMTFTSDRTFITSKGDALTVEVHGVATPDETGKSFQWQAAARDITNERRMTGEILRRNRELAVLNAVTTATAASLDLQSSLQAALSVLVDSMKYGGAASSSWITTEILLKLEVTTYEVSRGDALKNIEDRALARDTLARSRRPGSPYLSPTSRTVSTAWVTCRIPTGSFPWAECR